MLRLCSASSMPGAPASDERTRGSPRSAERELALIAGVAAVDAVRRCRSELVPVIGVAAPSAPCRCAFEPRDAGAGAPRLPRPWRRAAAAGRRWQRLLRPASGAARAGCRPRALADRLEELHQLAPCAAACSPSDAAAEAALLDHAPRSAASSRPSGRRPLISSMPVACSVAGRGDLGDDVGDLLTAPTISLQRLAGLRRPARRRRATWASLSVDQRLDLLGRLRPSAGPACAPRRRPPRSPCRPRRRAPPRPPR